MGHCTHLLRLGLFFMVASVCSCNSNSAEQRQPDEAPPKPVQVQPSASAANPRDYLSLAHSDSIVKRAAYFFSNEHTPDSFILKIAPGLVKSAPAELQISTANGDVIFRQPFEAWYFVRNIFVPDSIPTVGGQEVYDQYIDSYRRTLTQAQIAVFFDKSVAQFFSAINPISFGELGYAPEMEDMIADRDFWNEVAVDTTIRLIEMISFDREEGGVVIGFSKKRKKVITLMDYD